MYKVNYFSILGTVQRYFMKITGNRFYNVMHTFEVRHHI